MKIHVLSDLHMELSHFFPDQEALDQVDVVVLAGDIDTGAAGLFFAEDLLQAAPHLQIVYVAGNHEFYSHDLPKKIMQLQKRSNPKIHFLENRETVINVASRLFREHGFDGIGLKDLMEGAGLTQGAFYKQFRSKDDLAAQASKRALESASRRWSAAAPSDRVSLSGHWQHRQPPWAG